MKALQLSEDNELAIVDIAIPTPKMNEVLIAIKAAALNHRELWISKGMYPGMTLPCILGADGAGIVTHVGDNKNTHWLDEEVMIYPATNWGSDPAIPVKQFMVLGMPDPGTIAEYICVPVSNIVKKPKYLSWLEAAAVSLAGLTSWRALVNHGKIKEGDNVLITGIGGGVAQAGLLWAKSFGANIFVTSSSTDKINDAISKGAKGGVNYRDDNWFEQLKEISGGIDIVLDSSPSDNLDNYLKFLNMGARIVAYGSTGSRKTTLNISKFFLRHIQFIGSTMGSPWEFRDMIEHLEKHQIRPAIDSVYEFNNSTKAFDALATGKQTGKIVIEL